MVVARNAYVLMDLGWFSSNYGIVRVYLNLYIDHVCMYIYIY